MRLTLKNCASLWAALAVLPLFTSTSSAQILWDTTQGVDVLGDLSVDTTGFPLYAYNLGSGTDVSVNGVNFVGGGVGAIADLAGDGNVLMPNPDNGTGANFNNNGGAIEALLDSAQWALPNLAQTVELQNLTIGEEYLVQVFSSDTRGTRNNELVLDQGEAGEFTSFLTGANTNTPPGGNGAWVTGTFTASDVTESFTYIYSTAVGNANLNALQVRELNTTFIPGDFDDSGVVDVADFTILSNNLAGELDGSVTYSEGDIDFDGDVDLNDFGEFKDLFPGVVQEALGVPEPTSFGLLAIAGGLLTSMRSRRAGR